MAFLNLIGSFQLVCVVLSLLYHGRKCHIVDHALIFLEVFCLAIMFFILPPLVSFIIYFNVFNSARHFMRLRRMQLRKEGQTLALSKLWQWKNSTVAILT